MATLLSLFLLSERKGPRLCLSDPESIVLSVKEKLLAAIEAKSFKL
jgi:hypothetical protein